MDLTKPENDKKIGQVIAPSGGTTWTRIMFERQVLGEDYWKKQAATKPVLYPSGAPMSDALVRGEVSIAPLLYNIVYPKKKDGAPIRLLPARGRADQSLCQRHSEDRDASERREAVPELVPVGRRPDLHDQGAGQPDLAQGARRSIPKGFDPKVVKVWLPNFEQYEKLHGPWIEDWNKTYGYRQ